MSIEALNWAWIKELPTAQKIVLLALANFANPRGECFPSQAYIATRTGLSRQSVSRVIFELAELKLVEIVERQRRTGGNTSHLYRLALPAELLQPEDDGVPKATLSNGATAVPLTVSNGGTGVVNSGDNAVSNGATANKESILQESKRKKTQRARAPSLDLGFALPEWIPSSTWGAYVDMRKKIRRTLTDHAAAMIVKKLSDWRAEGHDALAILNRSILNSWQDVFLPDAGTGRRGASVTAVEFVDGRTWLARARAFFDGFDDEREDGTPVWQGPGFWVELWGPKPGDPGCRVPAEVLAQYDREKASRSRQIAQHGGGA